MSIPGGLPFRWPVVAAILGASRLAAPTACSAELHGDLELVPLHNGMNQVELGSPALAGMVMLAHRENFNAHSFELATFYLRTAVLESDPKMWQLIPFEIKTEEGVWKNSLGVSGGADCQVHTFRLLRARKEGKVSVLVADRATGESYADPGRVTFTWLQLEWNPDGGAGEPTARFKAWKTEKTTKLYCDVDEAIEAELHLTGAIAPKAGSLAE